ncbi:MAG: NUDIX hydrolase [Myxococcota bacterium]
MSADAPGTPPVPRPAATVIVARPAGVADQPPEILLLRRHAGQGFMANVWVFPGGRVDEADHPPEAGGPLDAHRAAAIRECAEEAGLALTGELIACAHWVTPASEKKRFDTRFYLSVVAAGSVATPDATEVTEALWITAADALARHARVDLPLAPPTWLVLHAMAACPDLAALEAWARAQAPEPVTPVLELVAGKLRVRSPSATLVLVQGRWELEAPTP